MSCHGCSKVRSELIATASAQAIMGDEGAAAYEKIQQRVQLAAEAHHGLKLAEKSLTALYKAGVNEAEVAERMGLSTKELSAKLKAGTVDAEKFGNALRGAVTEKGKGPLDVMMNSLGVIGKKASETFAHLFDGIDTKPLTDALRNLVALGDQGEPSGRAMKAGITTGMNAVIRMLGHGITEAEIFFLKLELFALQTYVTFKPLIKGIEALGKVGGTVGGGAIKTRDAVSDATGVDKATVADQGMRAAEILLAGFAGPAAQMTVVGIDAIGAIGDSKAQEVARAAGKKSGEAALEGIREGVQAHSPSLAAIRIGMDIGAGLGAGMERSPAPDRAARAISSNTLNGLAPKPGELELELADRQVTPGADRTIPRNALAGLGAGGGLFGGAPNEKSPTTIGPIHIAITAPDGVTDAHALSMTGLSAALERMQLGSGR